METIETNGLSGPQTALQGRPGSRTAAPTKDEAGSALWELRGGLTPNAPVQPIPIIAQPFSIGRDFESSLSLANPTISRHHAELMLVDKDLLVRDLDSRNGTYLNGRRVKTYERLQDGDMLQFGAALFTVHAKGARAMPRSPAEQCATQVEFDMGQYALANLEFDRLLTDPAVIPHFQPIVRLNDRQQVGFEVLARSRLIGLETPDAMFRVAVERGLEVELSDLVRRESLAIAKQQGLHGDLYLNTHPAELHRPGLVEALRQLRRDFPEVGIVVEIHESAVTSSQSLSHLRKQLKDLNIRLAYDDFGAGQSRLMELADVPPEVLKFDMRLIRGLTRAPDERQNMLRSLVQMVRDLAVIPLAEGIETGEEAIVCRELGFELGQGYFFGRPSAAPMQSAGIPTRQVDPPAR